MEPCRTRPRGARASLLVPVLLLACAAEAAGPTEPFQPFEPGPLPPLASGDVAVVGVTVVSMADGSPAEEPGRSVLIRDGLIVEIGPAATFDVPDGAEVVDGGGLWLAPGLIDMHVHLRRSELDAYRRAGITTVRNMWGHPAIATLREELAAGADHPTILSAGRGIDGDPPVWPETVVPTSAAAARDEVRRQVAQGWDFIKVYNRLAPPVWEAILDEADAAGIPVIGHVPFAVDVHAAGRAGQASIEHLTGIAEEVAGGRSPGGWLTFDPGAAAAVAAELAERGTWVCPTLAILSHLADASLSPASAAVARSNQGAMVKALHDAGVPLLAGTDAGIDVVPAGTSLADELDLLVAAGLTPFEALRAATAGAARFLGIEEAVGTVEVGKRADLVLLRADPLTDVSAVRDPVVVVQRGRVVVGPATAAGAGARRP